MSRKQRHLVYEMVAIMAALFFGVFTVPTLINAHDSIALMCAFGLIVVWVVWGAYFLYRLSKETHR